MTFQGMLIHRISLHSLLRVVFMLFFFFIRNDTYFGWLYDTKIANRIQSLSPVGQCLQFHPSLWSLILQHAECSAATALGSRRHQDLLRPLSRGQELSALGRSQLLLTKKPRWVVQRPMRNSVVRRFIPVMLKPENLSAIPFVAWDYCDRCSFIRYAQGLNHFRSPGECVHTQHAPEEGRRCRLTSHKVTKHSGSPVVNPGLFTNNYVFI